MKLISDKTYRYWKKKLLTMGIGLPDDDFIVIDPKSAKPGKKEERRAT
jgi:hypothetical protein